MHPGLLQNGQELLECFLIIINEKRRCYFSFWPVFYFSVLKKLVELKYENENPHGMLSLASDRLRMLCLPKVEA